MSNEIVVFHFKGGSSDKYWAIRNEENADGTHDIWYGRRGSRLRHDTVAMAEKSFAVRLNEKLKEGYEGVENATVDVESREVIFLDDQVENVSPIPDTLWYRLSGLVPVLQVQEFLDTTLTALAEEHEEDALKLKALPIFHELQQGTLSGGVEMSEGPLAVLLLFAFRRYLKANDDLIVAGDLVQIADDNNNLLPDCFDDLGELVVESCVALFAHCGYLNFDLTIDQEATRKNNVQHYVSLSNIRQLAIAMGCIDAPIDLTIISTETTAAYF